MTRKEPRGRGGSGQEPDPDEVVVEALMGASRFLTAVVARSLSEVHGSISTPQLRVLVMLSQRERLNLSAVADGLGVNVSNASRTCDRLVGAGLVSRRDDPADRRHLVLALTKDGIALVDSLMARRRAIFSQVTGQMSDDGRGRLAEGLGALLEAVAALPDAESFMAGEGASLHRFR